MSAEEKKQSLGGSSSNAANSQSVRTRADLILPQSKVKMIMKSSPEIEHIGHDALYLITKATELFIDHAASKSFSTFSGKGNSLQYRNLAELVQKNDNLDFLKDIIPYKTTARAALQEMAKQTAVLNKEVLE